MTVIWIEAAEVSVEQAVGKARSGWSAPGGSEWACCGWVCQWDVIEWDVLRVRQEGQMRGRCVEVQELPMWSPPPQPSPSVSVQSRNPVTCVPISSDGSLYCLPVSRSESPSRPRRVCTSFPHPAVPMAIPHTQTHTNGSSVGRRVRSEVKRRLARVWVHRNRGLCIYWPFTYVRDNIKDLWCRWQLCVRLWLTVHNPTFFTATGLRFETNEVNKII